MNIVSYLQRRDTYMPRNRIKSPFSLGDSEAWEETNFHETKHVLNRKKYTYKLQWITSVFWSCSVWGQGKIRSSLLELPLKSWGNSLASTANSSGTVSKDAAHWATAKPTWLLRADVWWVSFLCLVVSWHLKQAAAAMVWVNSWGPISQHPVARGGGKTMGKDKKKVSSNATDGYLACSSKTISGHGPTSDREYSNVTNTCKFNKGKGS